MTISTSSPDNQHFHVFFGGPDCRPRSLHDLLYSHVSAVPAGGEIFWATYYFRDKALADALIQAKKRGVAVKLTLEANTRSDHVNLPVLEMLQRPANLGSDCRALKHSCPDNLRLKKPRLHIKLYYFSHPEPHVLVGTFNPSGNQPEDREIIEEIGDQDQGHNYLVKITDSRLVLPLRDHLRLLHDSPHGPWERLLPRNNRVLTAGDSSIYLFPRLNRDVIRQKLLALPGGAILRMAISHLNDEKMVKTLLTLSKRGIQIEILAHDTERRVPGWVENQLDKHLLFRRYRHPQGCPMHNKFILIDTHQSREVIFGSMNFSKHSLYANHELLVVSSSSFLYDAFETRWQQMLNEKEALLS